jgi:hypothetical protein
MAFNISSSSSPAVTHHPAQTWEFKVILGHAWRAFWVTASHQRLKLMVRVEYAKGPERSISRMKKARSQVDLRK